MDELALLDNLKKEGQTEIAQYIQSVQGETRSKLLAELQHIDWAELQHPYTPPPISNEEVSLPRTTFAKEETSSETLRTLQEYGSQLYREGKVAAALVAGGQGTRLGFGGPKGCFPAASLTDKPLYQLHTEKVLSAGKRYGASVPFVIMTSDATHASTQDFFTEHNFFGMEKQLIRLFSQGMIPSVTTEGKVILGGPSTLLKNPDGHGGFVEAIYTSGILQQLLDEGKEYLVYNQVDNMLALYDDPLIVGLAARENIDVLIKVIKKRNPEEKVGCLVHVKERDVVVEYTDVTPEQTKLPAEDGEPIMRYGSTAMYCFSIKFLAKVCASGFKLPIHRSLKPLKSWTPDGEKEVKGYKNERFLHDILLFPEKVRVMGYLIQRTEEFAPVKSKEGEDTVESARLLATDEYRRWLREAGLKDESKVIEVSPLFAGSSSHFAEKVKGDQNLYDTAKRNNEILVKS